MLDTHSALANVIRHIDSDSDMLISAPLAFRIASFISRIVPRGKTALPRIIGQAFLKNQKFFVDLPKTGNICTTGQYMDTIVMAYILGGWPGTQLVLKHCLDLRDIDMVFYDVGANHGYISIAMCRDAPPGFEAIAFEPLPDLSSCIMQSARRNNIESLTVINAALSAKNGTSEFFLTNQSIHASFLARHSGARQIEVPIFALDSLVAAGALPPPSLMKIDVEGAELLVVEGAEQTLATKAPTLICECDENALRFGYTPRVLIGRLRELGYRRVTRLDRKSGFEEPMENVTDDDFGDFIVSL